MASPTRKLKVRRRLSQLRRGKARKARIAREGSTRAGLPLDKPNANEKAQKAAAQA